MKKAFTTVAILFLLLVGAGINQILTAATPPRTIEKVVTVEKVVEVEKVKEVKVETQIPLPDSCVALAQALHTLADEADATISSAVSSISELAQQAHTAAVTSNPQSFVTRNNELSDERDILADALIARADQLTTIDSLDINCSRDLG